MRKWRLPLTYLPKIEPVIKGQCTQTIRVRNINKKTGKQAPRKEVGDLVQFFRWSGRPYWSHPVTVTGYFPLTEIMDVKLFPNGILLPSGLFSAWGTHFSYDLAILDGIVPATGEELGRVLQEKNKLPKKGIEGQILRWNPKGKKEGDTL